MDGLAAWILAAVVTRIPSEDAAEDGTGFRGAGAPPRVSRSEGRRVRVCGPVGLPRERIRRGFRNGADGVVHCVCVCVATESRVPPHSDCARGLSCRGDWMCERGEACGREAGRVRASVPLWACAQGGVGRERAAGLCVCAAVPTVSGTRAVEATAKESARSAREVGLLVAYVGYKRWLWVPVAQPELERLGRTDWVATL